MIGIEPDGKGFPMSLPVFDWLGLRRETSCLVDLSPGLLAAFGTIPAEQIAQENTVIHIQRSRGYSSRKTISMEPSGAHGDLTGDGPKR